MKNDNFFHLAKLYELIASMEKDLGLDDLSGDERAMIYAITSLSGQHEPVFQSSDVKKHWFCSGMSSPTFYRNLKRLLSKGIIQHVDGKKTGEYVLLRRRGKHGGSSQ